jgi:ABC transporter with metal-binding/Fe-S-binding domain ATP-binding protein
MHNDLNMFRDCSSNRIKTAILFSGGKDSCLALSYALEYSDVVCLIIMVSKNPESYMFHTPNIRWAEKQAEAIGLPVIIHETSGEKEKELADLKDAINSAVKKYVIGGIVTGAIGSVYQSSRIQSICDSLGLECFNPLWQKDQVLLLRELTNKNFDVILVGVFGEGLDGFIGKRIDTALIDELVILHKKIGINPAGEGGEFESFVLDAPFFRKRLKINSSSIEKDDSGGIVMRIEDVSLTHK